MKQINDHYDLLEQHMHSDSIENQRVKKQILFFSQESILQTVMAKLWTAFLHLNYRNGDLKEHKSVHLLVPMNISIYKISFQLMIKGLMADLFCTD